MFEFWDWVGGRYSLWSAIALSIAIYIGMDNFEEMLTRGHALDQPFRTAPLEQHMPVIMAMLGICYTNFFHSDPHPLLPYDQGLTRFPAYLQPADMDSHAQFLDSEGKPV